MIENKHAPSISPSFFVYGLFIIFYFLFQNPVYAHYSHPHPSYSLVVPQKNAGQAWNQLTKIPHFLNLVQQVISVFYADVDQVMLVNDQNQFVSYPRLNSEYIFFLSLGPYIKPLGKMNPPNLILLPYAQFYKVFDQWNLILINPVINAQEQQIFIFGGVYNQQKKDHLSLYLSNQRYPFIQWGFELLQWPYYKSYQNHTCISLWTTSSVAIGLHINNTQIRQWLWDTRDKAEDSTS